MTETSETYKSHLTKLMRIKKEIADIFDSNGLNVPQMMILLTWMLEDFVRKSENDPLVKEMIELDNHVLRVYFDEKEGIVEAIEVLEKKESSRSVPKTTSPSGLSPMPSKPASMTQSSAKPISAEKVDFNSMTVKDLKSYAEEKKIELPTSVRKADIVEILEKTEEKKSSGRRQLPKIPSKDD